MQIQYVIAIHLIRWLTIFYDFSFKWTATAELEYTQLNPDFHSWWISKMQPDTLEERYAIKFCYKFGKNAMRWKLDLLLWSRDQETELPVESCWLSQTQESQTFDDPIFWQYWHDLHALGSHCTDNQQVIICWGFKGVQEEIPSEEASTLQIGSMPFPPGQCTSSQLHPSHRLFDQDGNQDSSSPSLESRPCSLWLLVIP